MVTTNNDSVLQIVLKLLMAGWTGMHFTPLLFGALLSLGAKDFDGNPLTAGDRVISSLTFVMVLLQIGMLPWLIKKTSGKVVGALAAVAFLPWLALIVVEGFKWISFIVPAIYTVGIGLLYAVYVFVNSTTLNNAKKRER